MTIEEYFGNWLKVLDKGDIKVIMEWLQPHKGIYPSLSNVFKAFKLCTYNKCKVVCIGDNNPIYKNTGILFGSNKEVLEEDLPLQLKILKELVINFEVYHNSIIFDNSLESWANQGMLLLNFPLTVEAGQSFIHINKWKDFIRKFLKRLSYNETGLVYMLFGEESAKLRPYINEKYNNIIEVKAPDYYYRTKQNMPNVFNIMNDILYKRYGEKIILYNN